MILESLWRPSYGVVVILHAYLRLSNFTYFPLSNFLFNIHYKLDLFSNRPIKSSYELVWPISLQHFEYQL